MSRRVFVLVACGVAGVALAAGPASAGDFDPDEQPDLTIRKSGDASAEGEDVFGTDGSQSSFAMVLAGQSQTWIIEIGNDGEVDSKYRLHGGGGDSNFAVKYSQGGQNITTAVRDGSYSTPKLAPQATSSIKVKIKGKSGAVLGGPGLDVNVVATAAKDPGDIDLVRATVDND